MKKTFIKWFVMAAFVVSALAGCYVHHHDDDYYRYHYGHDYGYGDRWHHDHWDRD